MTVTKDRILLDDLRLVGGVKCARNVPPQLRGGDDRALKKALDERERVVVDGVEGTVEACFYVNGLGRVTDVVIMKSLNHILDKYRLIHSKRIRLHIEVLPSGMYHHKADSQTKVGHLL